MGDLGQQEQSFGVIPIHAPGSGAGRRYLVVQHRKGHWGFPKGKPLAGAGETPLAAARRELAEETGITGARIVESPTFVETYAYQRGPGAPVGKRVTYFLGYVDREDVTIMPGELLDFAWSDAAGTAAKLTYPEARRLLAAVEAHLSGSI